MPTMPTMPIEQASSQAAHPAAGRGPLSVAILGAGARGGAYAKVASERPDLLRIAAVADPTPAKRDALAAAHGVPPAMRFASYADLARRPGLVEAVLNTTPDALHHESSLPLIEAGYDLLLEKPIALRADQVIELAEAARQSGRVVMVGHVLRYQLFYQEIKRLLDAGAIGRLRSLRAAEMVAFDHLATTFVRNRRYERAPEPTPMLTQKCCHDLDLIAWLVSGPAAGRAAGEGPADLKRVASYATPSQFVPANAPAGSTDRCLAGCAVEPACPYSARKLYLGGLTANAWDPYAFPPGLFGEDSSLEQRERSLAGDNPFGRCVWRCQHTALDHQNVAIEFAGGITATFDLFCATPVGGRTIQLFGTGGEIAGETETGRLMLRRLSADGRRLVESETLTLPADPGGHGGGDRRLVEDFVASVRREPGARGLTRIEHSVTGHLIAFAADAALRGA